MKKYIFAVFAASMLVAMACQYTPDEEYFKEVAHPEPEFALSLNNYKDGDTIVLYKAADFQYNIGVINGKLDQVKVTFGGQIIQTGTALSDNFSIAGYNLKTGIFELKIEFLAKEATGSLADHLGLEKQYQVWRKWVVKIDVDAPAAPQPVFSIENGFLKLSWNAYTKPNFEYYSVYRSGLGGKSVTITDARQNFWIDSAYTGGYYNSIDYSVTVKNSASSNNARIYKNDVYTFRATLKSSDSTAVLTWSRVPYYNALKECSIRLGTLPALDVTNASETTLTTKVKDIVFGQTYIATFEIKPKYSSYTSYQQASLILGEPMKKILSGVYYSRELNRYIGHYKSYSANDWFYYYDQDLNAVDSISFPSGTVSVPYPGRYAYYFNYSQIGRIDLTDHSVKTKLTGYSTYGYGASNGLALYNHSTYVSGRGAQDITTIFDFDNNSEAYTEAYFKAFSSSFSANGKFIHNSDKKVYAFANPTATLVGTSTFTGTFQEFRPDKAEEMIVERGNYIDIYNAGDLALVRTLTLPFSNSYTFSYSFDPVTQNMLWTQDGTSNAYLVNIETGASRKIACYSASGSPVRMVNGVLFHYDGRYIKIM